MIKLIVSDIDGTLVPDGGGPEAINPEYFEAIKELKSKGIMVVLASGRQYTSMRRVFHPVEDELLYISQGGTMVFEHGQVIYSTPLSSEVCKRIVTDIEHLPECDAMVCGMKSVYVENEDSKLYRWMKDCYRYDIEAVGERITSMDDEIVKVSVFSRNDTAGDDGKEWFIPKWSKELQVSLAGIQWIDLVPQGTGKGSALSFIQKRYGITKNETMVFGDNYNDIDMFGQAGISYAVDNADKQVKKHATHICAGYEKDGVLEKWRKIIYG